MPTIQQSLSEKHSSSQENRVMVESLLNSRIFQEYEKAFSETTGMPVSFRAVESWQLPHHGKRHENPLCAAMATRSKSCASCLRLQEQLSQNARVEPATVTCQLGLVDTAVPVRLGERLIGFLQTGQVLRQKVSDAQMERTAQLLAECGVEVSRQQLEKMYGDTQVLTKEQYGAMVKLLAIFAEHLAAVSNEILVKQIHAESPVIQKARAYILENQGSELSLGRVAKAVNASPFHFCKLFRKATGLNFTAYVSRVRVEKARQLLLNPNLRIGEIAYETGFQSLTHFNRVFRKITGQSPSQYRAALVSTKN